MLGFEASMAEGGSKGRGDTMTFGGREYAVGAMLDTLKERRGKSGAGDAEFVDHLVGGSTRKTRNCFTRLMNVLASEEIKDRFVQSEQQANRTDLVTGAVGPRKNIWLEVREIFVNPKAEVR